MAKQLFANNASSLLAASINDTDLTIQVAGGYGALYPNPGVGEFFIVALENSDGDIEFVKIESRTTDLLTVAIGGRGQDGSSPQSWVNGQTRVEVRATKGTLERFIQRDGDTMSGALDMQNNNVVNARLTGTGWRGTNGQLIGTALRGAVDDASNEILVPSGGGRATAGGEQILVASDVAQVSAAAFDVGMIMQWFGAAINCPAHWHICDGTNGTPDMRDKFVVGAGNTYAVGAVGGAAAATSTSAGSHTHTGTVGDHTLTIDEMPAHTHNFQGNEQTNISNSGGGRHAYFSDGILRLNNPVTGIPFNETTGASAPHSHTLDGITSAPDHSHSVATLPPYKALYFIMYTG